MPRPCHIAHPNEGPGGASAWFSPPASSSRSKVISLGVHMADGAGARLGVPGEGNARAIGPLCSVPTLSRERSRAHLSDPRFGVACVRKVSDPPERGCDDVAGNVGSWSKEDDRGGVGSDEPFALILTPLVRVSC